LFKTEQDQNSLFCSELVASCYQKMGLLSFDRVSNQYLPRDFSEPISLQNGALLSSIYNFKKRSKQVKARIQKEKRVKRKSNIR
jgi:hypothetical protein